MSGYVYAIGIVGTQYVKIGHARRPEKRLAALQGGLPFKLELLYVLKVDDPRGVERTLHELLADGHVRGEWFELPEEPLPRLFTNADKSNPFRPRRPGQHPPAKVRHELAAILNGETPLDDEALREWLKANILDPWVLPSKTPSGRKPPNSFSRTTHWLLEDLVAGKFFRKEDFRPWLRREFLEPRRKRR